MVEAGLGVAILPALTAVVGSDKYYQVNLYKTYLDSRRLVALTPNQFANVDPSKSFVNSLAQAGQKLMLPEIFNVPYIFKETVS